MSEKISQIRALQSRRLRGALRRAREAGDYSRADVAKAMGWSASKLVRIENGSTSPRPSDVMALLMHYEVPDVEREELVDLTRRLPARDVKEEEFLARVFSKPYRAFLETERACDVERQWTNTLIPGMLQTEEYAYEILNSVFRRSKKEASDIIAARMDRQQLLNSPEGPSFTFVLDEALFMRPVASAQVMKAQIQHLIEINELGGRGEVRAKVGLLPFEVGPTPGWRGPFILLEFSDELDDDSVFMETPNGDFFSKNDKDVTSEYQEYFDEIEAKSLFGESFRKTVERRLGELPAIIL